jgi:hypothetical protein
LVEGAPELVGLDMALTTWYDEMKRDFNPGPMRVAGVDLELGEEVLLAADGVSLLPHKPSPLFGHGWTGAEAPEDQKSDAPHLGEWESIGEGRLLLTDQRAIWQGPGPTLSFYWSRVTALYLWLRNTLGIRYGTARYRIGLGSEVGLKWLTYSGTLARRAERESGFELTTSPY